MARRVAADCAVGLVAGVLLVGCGGSSNSPTPISQGPPTIPPTSGPSVNLAPVIESISVSAERVELDSELTLTANVKDQETPLDQLKFEWKAEAGSFSGDGASVKWRAPKDIKTPADYEIKLTVTEAYGTPDSSGVRPQNVATATAPSVRVHNSTKELGDMSIQFLSDFATSSVSASACLRDFTDSCRGKADEQSDIEYNRVHFEILSSSLKLRSVVLDSSGSGANVVVACAFSSRIKKCDPGESGCVIGSVSNVSGDCIMTGKYEQKRWWLCDSHFLGRLLGPMRRFFGTP